ncbi:hypothetical protein RFI_08155 [Reticulomyxa filosa]|uniref:Bromodomain containing protein n=1 Tax=Reticulomyxa filosa TaxID=46433 RepID=X6NTA1_RETFI|nr:hypothetical protein RFI_08155 [Reticulomyxa filosa]|eukprot:ETO28969.1 hypothetical protein RFI_08155 [Reticulomyxa filosa]
MDILNKNFFKFVRQMICDISNHQKKMSGVEPADELAQCGEILKDLQSKPEAEPFLEPVDWRALKLPDYPQIIKNPMDLGTIASKLGHSEYKDSYAFAEDVRLVWRNAKRYNTPGSGIYVVAENLAKIFERKFARIKKKIAFYFAYVCNDNNKSHCPRNKRETKKLSSNAWTHTKKKMEINRKLPDKVKGKESTHADRVKFTELIKKINSDQLGKVVEIIDKKCPAALNSLENEEDIEIEVYHIDADTLHQLIDYCTKCVHKLDRNATTPIVDHTRGQSTTEQNINPVDPANNETNITNTEGVETTDTGTANFEKNDNDLLPNTGQPQSNCDDKTIANPSQPN